MRIPTSRLDDVAQGAVSTYATDYTLYRATGDGNDSYGESSSGEYNTLENTRSLYLFSPRERSEQVVAGEVTEADLSGLALPHVDVREDDRVDHGSARYEVETIDPVPSAEDPDVRQLSLSRV